MVRFILPTDSWSDSDRAFTAGKKMKDDIGENVAANVTMETMSRFWIVLKCEYGVGGGEVESLRASFCGGGDGGGVVGFAGQESVFRATPSCKGFGELIVIFAGVWVEFVLAKTIWWGAHPRLNWK